MASTLSDYKGAIGTTTTTTTLDKETSAKAAALAAAEQEEANRKTDLVANLATPSNYNNNNNHNNNVNKSLIEITTKTTTTSLIDNKEAEKMDNMSNDSSHGIEKFDAPENLHKHEQEDEQHIVNNYNDDDDDDVTKNPVQRNSHLQYTTMPEEAFVSAKKEEEEPVSPANSDAQAAKYRSMLERFENRHKRGASLSKLETEPTSMPTPAANEPSSSASISMSISREQVNLRARSSTPRSNKDFGKRRSWSPRAFTNKPSKSAIALPSKSKNCTDDDQQAKNLQQVKSQVFKPRSKCMQKALLEVSQQPLEDDFKKLNMQSADAVSETGTYVLDGDHYTEEQKSFMNIDKTVSDLAFDYSPTSLPPSPASISPTSPTSLPSPIDYTPNDFGCVTSITADGVLNRKRSETSSITDSYKDAQVLSTVSKKTAWVKEWARNVRARSLAKEFVGCQTEPEVMTQSFNLGLLQPQRDLSEDDSSSAIFYTCRSSQSKIPSPLHSTRRASSARRLFSSADSSPSELQVGSCRLGRSRLVCTDIPHIESKHSMAASLSGLSPQHRSPRERLNSFDGNLQMQEQEQEQLERSNSNHNFSYMLDYLNDDALHDIGAGGHSRHSTSSPVARQMSSMAASPMMQSRSNKTFLMRKEASKNRVNEQNNKINGIAACPNTPELPRRYVATIKKSHVNMRRSEPRDAKAGRHDSKLPTSLSVAKKQLLQSAQRDVVTDAQINRLQMRAQSAGASVPKYMDISKFKPQQANQFLRKNESRITLKTGAGAGGGGGSGQMKRSPSASGLARSETSARSNHGNVRAYPSCMTSSGNAFPGINQAMTTSLVQSRGGQNVLTQKDVDMALWKRRSTYDPMRAAAEDRRRKKEQAALKKRMNDEGTP